MNRETGGIGEQGWVNLLSDDSDQAFLNVRKQVSNSLAKAGVVSAIL